MKRHQSSQVAHGDITTAYYDEGDGPVLLLLHGFTGSKLDFHDQVNAFSGSYRVVVPDNRGHGESTNSGDESIYTLTTLVDDLSGFVDALNIGKFHLLGHSLGGMVVMRYALANAARVESLVLMDTASGPLDLPENRRQFMARALRSEGVSGLVQVMRNAPSSPEVQNGIDHLGAEEHWSRIEEKLAQMDPAAMVGLGNELGNAGEITEALSAIGCPTTVVVGEADAPFLSPSRVMAATIPGAVLQIIDGAAHCPQYENAGEWTRVIRAHLDRAANPDREA